MDIAGVNLNLLTALHALLEERSVTRAAQRVGVTQPSMSYSLQQLRLLFDDPLLVRGRGTLVPTPLAEALQQRGIHVSVYDPHIEPETFPESVEVFTDLSQAKGHDLAVLVTAHQACVDLDWSALSAQMKTPRIYDGRRVLDLEALEETGWTCFAVGRPLSS